MSKINMARRIRNIARHIPGLKAVKRIMNHEKENRRLISEIQRLHQIIFEQESLVSRSAEMGASGVGELPVPPPPLRSFVAGTTDLEWFLRSGKLGVETLVEVLGKHGMKLEQFRTILDQGCGCGRVLRYLDFLPPGRLHGCDINSVAIRWCQNNLPHATCIVNGTEPPLPYPDQMFDLIYSWSIFTHLPEPLQTAWIQELRRVLAPGGYLLMSLHGDSYLTALSESQRRQYAQGQLVIQGADLASSNLCAVFHPESYVRNVLARGFVVIDFMPQGAKGNPTQDVYLLQRSN
jgi:SAM-dependent methyltransferase